jgi:hypothetical protein
MADRRLHLDIFQGERMWDDLQILLHGEEKAQ